MDKFKEQIIFNLEKDEAMRSAHNFKAKMIRNYDMEEKDISNLRAKIVNYQIEKYGDTLSSAIIKPSLREQKNETQRRNAKRKKVFYGIQ